MTRGYDWLASQVRADGTLTGEAASIATAQQAQTETLQTLSAAGRLPAALLETVRNDASLETESVTRRGAALAAASVSVSDLSALLRGNAAVDGGFGAEAGYPANPLDTSFALIGLRIAGVTRDTTIAQALGYLTGVSADGVYGEGQPAYATAYALIAMQRWRADYDLSAAIARSRAALVAMQANGAYESAMENAIAALALNAIGASTDAQGTIAALRATQSTNGSWGDDPYVTALALRALNASAETPSDAPAQLVGEVVDGNTNLPLSGASATLLGLATPATSGSDGRFNLSNVAAGSYRLRVARSGYATIERDIALSAGTTLDAGKIALAPTTGSAILRGVVTDTKQHLPQAGVTVSLSGAVTTQAVTDANGRYEFVGLPAGAVTVTTSKVGFTGNSETIQLFAHDTLWYSTWVCPTGEQPPVVGSASLKGRVVRAADQSPIAGATVVMGAQSVSTTPTGEFSLEGLASGAFAAEIRAEGYSSVALSGSLASGVNDAGTIAMLAGQSETDPDSSTLVGRITSRASGDPVSGVHVFIDGVEMGVTNPLGDYRITGVTSLRMALSFRAAGYETQDIVAEVSAHGVYRFDRVLDTAAAGEAFQILAFSAQPESVSPGDMHNVTAQIAHLGEGPRMAVVRLRILDGLGLTQAVQCAQDAAGTNLCEQQFAAGETLNWSLRKAAANLPAGQYQFVLHVVEPGTTTSMNPIGVVLARASQDVQVLPKLSLVGSINPSPPAVIPNSPTGVTFSATLRNSGNAEIPAGSVRLAVRKRGTTQIVHEITAALQTLPPNDIADVDFGNWNPPTGAEYDLEVTAVDPVVSGRIQGQLYVGDAARGEFTVTPNAVADGNQSVQGRIAVTGVDNPSGAAADPLFALVKKAVTDGGVYTAANAKSWQAAQGCSGCHIQTQSLYGLASSIGKADIDVGAAKFLYNSQASLVHPNGAVDSAHNHYYNNQSLLALWSMGTWPDAEATFASRYRIAEFLMSRRTVSTNFTYWRQDHQSGWLNGPVSATATIVEGIAKVLRDADEHDIDSIEEFAAPDPVPQLLLNASARFDVTPDGDLLVLESTQLRRVDPDTGASTVLAPMTVGGEPVSVAAGPNGEIYAATSLPALVRVTASGAEVVTRSLPAMVDIDVEVSGDVVVYGADRSVRRVTANGAISTLVPAGPIPGTPYAIAAFRDGSIRVVSSAGAWLTRISADGTITRETSGALPLPTDVAEHADGSVLMQVQKSVQNPGSILRFENGIAERLVGVVSPTRMATGGGRTFVQTPKGAAWEIKEVVSTQRATTSLAAMRSAMTPIGRYLVWVSNPDPRYAQISANADFGFALAALAEAKPFVTDPVLKAQIEERITAVAAHLRATQRPDGGWGIFASWGWSDPLATSIVGTGLDYLAPPPTDPVLRKTVSFLLGVQAENGSWNSYYFSTRLGSTSYVMAYLPKAFTRLSGIAVGMELEFPSNISFSGSSLTPTASTPTADGGMRYTFDLGRVTSRELMLDFQLALQNLLPLEVRAAARSASLTFLNGFNGEQVRVPIAIPDVHVSNGYALTLALNRTEFYANEVVDVLPTVRNLGSRYTDGTLRYFIETPDGVQVAELDQRAFESLAVNTERVIAQQWNTGTTLAGPYRARVQLFGPDGTKLGEQQLPFRILAGTGAGAPTLRGNVATDKAEYDPFEQVTILGRVRNEAPNLGFTNLTLNEVVTSPDGTTTTFSGSAPIAQLLPSTLADRNFPFALGAAAPGVYQVQQTVTDASGAVLDTRSASFRVRSTAQTGVGLVGTITATPDSVEQGNASLIAATATNQGNADMSAVPLVLSVIDPAHETVLWSTEAIRDLPRGTAVPLSSDWNTAGVPPGDYVAVLSARIGEASRTLAHTPIKVTEPPVRAELSLEVSGDNRLLVLVTCRIGNGRAEDEACVAQRVPFLHTLLTDMGITHTIVTSTDAFRREFRSGRYNTYWISGGAEKLANPLAEEVREAVFRGDGLLVDGNHDSRNQILDDALGVRHTGQLAGNAHQLLVGGAVFPATQYAVPGDALRYDLAGAQVHGWFDAANGQAALMRNTFGNGGAVLHAYDLVRTLQETASAAAARTVLERSLQQILGPQRSGFLAGEYVDIGAKVQNLAREANLVLDVATAEMLHIVATNPAASTVSAHFAEWTFLLEEGAQRWFDTGVTLPDTNGNYAVDAEVLHRLSGSERSLDTATLNVGVVSSAALADALLVDLRALALAAPAERNARDRVVDLIGQANAELAAGRHDDAIGTLLRSLDELAKLSSVTTKPYRVRISQLMGVIERKWVPAG